jgi:multidrug efflux pump subunit AcrB
MLVAITVVPTAAANFALHDMPGDVDPPGASARGGMRAMLGGINWLVATATRRLTVMALTLGICTYIIVELTPPAEYLPPGEEPKVFGRMNAPPGYNLPTMRKIGYEVQEYFLPYLGHEPGQFERGETAVPALDYLILSIRPTGLFLISEPKDKSQVNALMDAIDAKYSEYAGMRSFSTRGSIITSNDGGTRSINLDFSGPDLEPIYAAASAAYNRAREVLGNPRIRANPATLSLSQPLIEIHPDWERAAELGMSTSDIGFTVAALTDGAYVDEFFLADDKIDMYVYSESGPDASPHGLTDLPIYTRGGGVVPLSSIARVVETVDTNEVRRIDGRRTVTLNVIPPDNIALETGVDLVRSEVLEYLRNSGDIPASVSVDISGASDQLEATQKALTGNYLVALVLVYLVMVAIFTHWGFPLLIMTTIPLGVAGGIAGLALMNAVGSILPAFGMAAVHQPFDMISMLGFLILMGTVVNNPILIVHRAAENYRELAMSATEAVNEAVESRLRPIAMSAITTIFGLAPLVFIPGEGTELYRGVGAIVLFGLAGAAVVTLTFLPAATVTVLSWTRRNPEASDRASVPGSVGAAQPSGGSL